MHGKVYIELLKEQKTAIAKVFAYILTRDYKIQKP